MVGNSVRKYVIHHKDPYDEVTTWLFLALNITWTYSTSQNILTVVKVPSRLFLKAVSQNLQTAGINFEKLLG